MTLRVGDKKVAGANYSVSLFEINDPNFFGVSKYSDIDPNSPAWLKSKNQWNSKDMYPDFWEWLLEERTKTSLNVFPVGYVVDESGLLANGRVFVQKPIDFSKHSSFTIHCKFTTGSDIDTAQGIFSCVGPENSFGLYMTKNTNKIKLYLSSVGSSWDLASGLDLFSLTTNTTYWIKLEFTGSEYKCSYKTSAEAEWTLVETIASTDRLFSGLYPTLGMNRGTTAPFLGSIDLSECYIDLDNKRWWSGFKSKVVTVDEYYDDFDYVIDNVNGLFRLPLKNGEENLVGGEFIEEPLQISENIMVAPCNGKFTVSKAVTAAGQYFTVTIYTSEGTITDIPASSMVAHTSSNKLYTSFPVSKGNVIALWYNASGESLSSGWAAYKGKGDLYYFVGDVHRPVSETDPSEIVNVLTNKVDIGGQNFSSAGFNLLSSLGMPSERKISLTFGADGTEYTAPANGWFFAKGELRDAKNKLRMTNRTNSFAAQARAVYSGEYVVCFIPCRKGDVIALGLDAAPTSPGLTFYYSEGSQ